MSIVEMANRLKLSYIKENNELAIQHAIDNNMSYRDFLNFLLENEILKRDENGVYRRIKNAKFPFVKTFSELDLNFYSADISCKIRELQSLSFIETKQNVILIGNSGVGKTHTAISLGIKACNEGYSVLFITVPNLVIELKESMSLHQLTSYKNKFINYDLVILDELGYISFDKEGSELFFNLLSMRNEKKPIVITSNLQFNKWKDIFNDTLLTTALVDRLVHKSHVINIKGDSYRVKETKDWLGISS